MSGILVRQWWALILRGLFSALFGALALVWPGATLTSLILLFGLYSLVHGVFALAAAVQQRDQFWALAVEGMVGIAAGLFTFMWPGLTALAMVYLIALWAGVTGALQLAAAIRLRKVIEGEVWLGLCGVTSILFGLLMVIWPVAGATAVVGLIGIYALMLGALQIGLGFRLRERKERERRERERKEQERRALERRDSDPKGEGFLGEPHPNPV